MSDFFQRFEDQYCETTKAFSGQATLKVMTILLLMTPQPAMSEKNVKNPTFPLPIFPGNSNFASTNLETSTFSALFENLSGHYD